MGSTSVIFNVSTTPVLKSLDERRDIFIQYLDTYHTHGLADTIHEITHANLNIKDKTILQFSLLQFHEKYIDDTNTNIIDINKLLEHSRKLFEVQQSGKKKTSRKHTSRYTNKKKRFHNINRRRRKLTKRS